MKLSSLQFWSQVKTIQYQFIICRNVPRWKNLQFTFISRPRNIYCEITFTKFNTKYYNSESFCVFLNLHFAILEMNNFLLLGMCECMCIKNKDMGMFQVLRHKWPIVDDWKLNLQIYCKLIIRYNNFSICFQWLLKIC